VHLVLPGAAGRYFIACYPTKRSGTVYCKDSTQLWRAQRCTCCLPKPTPEVTGGERDLPKILLGMVDTYQNSIVTELDKGFSGGAPTIVDLAYAEPRSPFEGIRRDVGGFVEGFYRSKAFANRFVYGFHHFNGYKVYSSPAFRWFLEKTIAIVTIIPTLDPSMDPNHEFSYLYRPLLDEKPPGATVTLRQMLETLTYICKVSPGKMPKAYSRIEFVLKEDANMDGAIVLSDPYEKVPFA